MAALVNHVTFDCADPYELAGFWSEVTGWSRYADDKPGDEECALVPPGEARPWLLFIRVPEAKAVKNRLHLDVQPGDRTREEGGARRSGRGAELGEDHRRRGGRGGGSLGDPEGDEFCIERSSAERAPR